MLFAEPFPEALPVKFPDAFPDMLLTLLASATTEAQLNHMKRDESLSAMQARSSAPPPAAGRDGGAVLLW